MMTSREIELMAEIDRVVSDFCTSNGDASVIDRWKFIQGLIVTAADPETRLTFLEELLQGWKQQ